MERQLDFYQVDAKYIAYLLDFDSRVPKVDYTAVDAYEKFLCGIVLSIHGHDYFAPISSFRTPQRTNIIIKDVNGKDVSSIRFSFMIPVPPDAISVKRIADEPSDKYRVLLNMELQYCRKNANAIYSRAKFVYDSVTIKNDPLMVKNCCDFKKLEAACAEYISKTIIIEKPDREPDSES
jgi:protein AbiQ